MAVFRGSVQPAIFCWLAFSRRPDDFGIQAG